MPEQTSNRGLIIGIIVASILLFAGFTWLVVQSPSETTGNGEPKDENVTFNDAVASKRGPYEDKDMKVAVHMYSDLQCPACRAQEPALLPIMQKYQDMGVRFYWKDFPLTQIHKNARVAANAGRCAEDQGWFWTFREKVYQEQASWEALADPRPRLIELADQSITDKTRFNRDKFQACVQSNADDARVAADMSEGFANGIDRTPTYFIGKKRYFSMTPAEWQRALDEALAAVATSTPASTATTTTP